jgi:hypothetical protein
MDDSDSEDHPLPSAADIMRQMQEQIFGPAPPAVSQPPIISPSSIHPGIGNLTEHLEATTASPPDPSVPQTSPREPLSIVEELNRQIGLSVGGSIEDAGAGGNNVGFETPSATVAPADLTTSLEHASGIHEHISLGDQPFPAQGAEHLENVSGYPHPDGFGLDMDAEEQEDDAHGRHFTVTLPMAANTRQTYLNTIAENRAIMFNFGEVFASSDERVPDAPVVARMDAIFERLLDLCDLPAYDDSIPDMGKGDMMKHATNSNSKFSFIYEFLKGLEDINIRVLILSQPGRVFEYIEAVVLAIDRPYSILGQEGSGQQSIDGMSVVLAVSGQDLSAVQGGVDVVIAFDHTARSVELPATLNYESMAPIVLALVATYSLEHIDQQLLEIEPEDIDFLERKNALNLATGTAAKYLRSPERQYPEPHEAAKVFADFLRSPESGLDWEPHPLPADIFDLWLSSQERGQQTQALSHPDRDVSSGPGTRKRPSVSVLR